MSGGKRAKASRARPRARTVPRRTPGRTVLATQAARRFSDLLNRVQYRRESFVIERGGLPVCEVSPVGPTHFTLGDLASLFRSRPTVDEAYLRDVENAVRSQPPLPLSPWES
jgi:antitoxin (DNA-binding transcriptional repressor) of toxin-antitoxin stability system